jgi:hypothetical protein
MGQIEREDLINTYLELLSGIPTPIQYENARFELPALSEVYLQVWYFPPSPERVTHSGSHLERWSAQINVLGALARNSRAADVLAEQLQAHFVSDTTFAGTGEKTRVRSKPSIVRGYSNGKRWIIPVLVQLETLPT